MLSFDVYFPVLVFCTNKNLATLHWNPTVMTVLSQTMSSTVEALRKYVHNHQADQD
jgi:hypothetical protein